MRFMMLVKHAEKSGPPPKEFTDAMAILSEEAVKAGTIRGSGGLAPTAQSTRVRLSSGQIKVTDGPFTEAKEHASPLSPSAAQIHPAVQIP